MIFYFSDFISHDIIPKDMILSQKLNKIILERFQYNSGHFDPFYHK